MTMATNGKQIEELPPDEKNRELRLRLRYFGALGVLVDAELRVSAARLIATHPLVREENFVERAREAFRHVVGEVCMGARDARNLEAKNVGEVNYIVFDIFELGEPAGRVSLLTTWSEEKVLTVLECGGYVLQLCTTMFKGWPTDDNFEMVALRDGGCARYFKFVAARLAEQASKEQEDGHAG